MKINLPDSGSTFYGDWHYNEVRSQWEGNPVDSVEVEGVITSIRHKLWADGEECTHAAAMEKENMDSILTWAQSVCPLRTAFNLLHYKMAGLGSPPPAGSLDMKAMLSVTRHTEYLALSSVAFTLWTRYVCCPWYSGR